MKKLLITLPLLLVLVVGCATLTPTNITSDPELAYYVALRGFNGSWESYHKIWVQLDDVKKKEWVNKYHKTFDEASLFLDLWANDPTNPDPNYDGKTWKLVAEKIETLLIQLAIK